MTQPTEHDLAPELTDLMTRSVQELRPPLDRLQRASVAEGRRIRRRRHGLAVLGGVAAASALVVLVAPGTGSPAADRDRVADVPSSSVSAVPTPTSAPVPQDGPAGFWSMPATEMRARLRTLLPDGTQLSHIRLSPADKAPGEPAVSKGWLKATVTRAGIDGESTIELMLWGPERAGEVGDPGGDRLVLCPGDLVAPSSCDEIEGQEESIGRIAEIVDGTLVQRLTTVKADTGYVYAAIANTTDDKWGPSSATSGEAPALTAAELVTIAGAATWTDWSPTAGQ